MFSDDVAQGGNIRRNWLSSAAAETHVGAWRQILNEFENTLQLQYGHFNNLKF